MIGGVEQRVGACSNSWNPSSDGERSLYRRVLPAHMRANTGLDRSFKKKPMAREGDWIQDRVAVCGSILDTSSPPEENQPSNFGQEGTMMVRAIASRGCYCGHIVNSDFSNLAPFSRRTFSRSQTRKTVALAKV